MAKRLNSQTRARVRDMVSKGFSDAQIAEELHVGRTTAWQYRKLIEEDEEQRALNRQLRLRHFDRLTTLAGKLANFIRLPDDLQLFGKRPLADILALEGPDRVLLRALREHLKGDAKGRDFHRWEQAADAWDAACNQALAAAATWIEPLPSDVRRADFLHRTVVLLAVTDEPVERRIYTQRESQEEGMPWRIEHAGICLAEGTKGESYNRVLQLLQETRAKFVQTQEGAAALQAWANAVKQQRELQETLWELSVMDGFPGACRICPVPRRGVRKGGTP